MRIALATARRWVVLTSGDALVARMLADRGHRVDAAVWNDPDIDWSRFDAVVIRSCWDYHRHHDAFLGWLASIEASGVRVWNEGSLIGWNSDKRYLLDLRDRGVPIVDTILIEDGVVSRERVGTLDRDQTIAAGASRRFVVKPTVSASGEGLELVQEEQLPMRRPHPVLVQRFVPEIVAGELSIIAFDSEIAYGVLKRPAAGDFRVQADYGGSAEPHPIGDDERGLAESILALLPGAPLYARLDLVRGADGLRLMELELVEPELFLHLAPECTSRFADAIERRLAGD